MESRTWNIASLILKGYSLFLRLVYLLPDFALMGGIVKIDFAEKLSSARYTSREVLCPVYGHLFIDCVAGLKSRLCLRKIDRFIK